MNIKYVKCLLFGHDVSDSESITTTLNSNNWIKKCNCCGKYLMHGDIGSVCMSEEEALKIKNEFDEIYELYKMN